jgi:hypothetical protein
MSAICRNVALVPQPVPARNKGGDCFACATLAAMRHLFPENPPTFDQCWEAFEVESTDAEGVSRKHLSNTFPGMRGALWNLYSAGWKIEIVADRVDPRPGDPEHESHNWGAQVGGYEYARRLEAWLHAGYVALGNLMYRPCKTGEWTLNPDGSVHRNHNDHFVLYDGVRSGWRRHAVVDGARTLVYQVHVVCSANGGRSYWIDVDDLLTQHGAGGWWLIRPDMRGELPAEAS